MQLLWKNLQDKILNGSRGGLCYELNTFFYYFLKDCGYDVQLALGTVYKNDRNAWALENGHYNDYSKIMIKVRYVN